jgi:RNA polymerase sigma-70 factor (ECF subfamily)
MTYEEIAEKLGLSKNTVRNHMTEAIRSVKDYVEGHPDISCLVIAIMLSETTRG